jgi:hypothetical protein
MYLVYLGGWQRMGESNRRGKVFWLWCLVFGVWFLELEVSGKNDQYIAHK